MRDTPWRETGEHLYEGETRKLELPPAQTGKRCGNPFPFPWQALWLIWPLLFVVKGAAHLAAPLLNWLSQPIVLSITPLPLLLIGAGLALLLIGAAHRRGR